MRVRPGLMVFACTMLTMAAPLAGAQIGAAKPEFEVATVKVSAPLDLQKLAADVQAGKMPNIGMHITGLRAEYNYLTMKQLLAVAYKVKEYQITGPGWLATDHFDIVAKMPDGSSKDDAPAMLKTLLEERFKLVAHTETQDHPVYALLVGKDGPKLKESPPPKPIDPDSPLAPGETKMTMQDGKEARIKINTKDGSSTINMGEQGIITEKLDMGTESYHIDSTSATMEAFADMLTQIMQMGGGGSAKPVVDMTGLKSNYQVSLDISMAELMEIARSQAASMGVTLPNARGGGAASGDASDPGGGSSVFKSVEAMGLKLEPRKAPIEQVIVDSMEKTPTEN